MTTASIRFQPSGVVRFDKHLCVGCGTCELMCALYHEGVGGPGLARIRVTRDPFNAEYQVGVCQQCLAPSCYVACPTPDEALCIDGRSGARYVDRDYCTACDECVLACPFDPKHVRTYPESRKAYKCDLCMKRDEGPICVEYCPVRALSLLSATER